ncbi:TetR/AcrR family transcriptional regulator [Salidesulfovibrio onnuriiensis]|uniref:TetR/AcrR family transcriptional regulator n=1 Tax=Salidesulfovibrio onnuriiensis TaxID=2583823 RepID=UPI0011C98A34|nr:TetR/AcrR family transcriptional regulator [Salidesulfovibrio onnuriiensis]
MGRKKLDQQRKAQILEAFGACVLKFGLDGSGISAVAREAGLSRTLVHHFVGTRDELVSLLAEHVLHRHRSEVDEFLTWARKGVPLVDLLAEDFDFPQQEGVSERALYAIMNTARSQYPDIDNAYRTILDDWAEAVGRVLFESGRGRDETECRSTAVVLLAILAGCDMIRALPDFELHKKALKNQLKHVVESVPER